MNQCSSCGKLLSQVGAAVCGGCSDIYHKECVGLRSSAALGKGWMCPGCQKKLRKGHNSCTPVKPTEETLNSFFMEEVAVSPPQSAPACPSGQYTCKSQDPDIVEMRRELAQYMTEQREFREELRKSMACVSRRIDGLELRIEAIEVKDLTPVVDEVAELKLTVNQLKLDLNDRDQESLLADVDIGHLPEEKGENVVHTVILLAAKLGITLEDRDLVYAERVGAVDTSGSAPSGRPRRVVARLSRSQLRDDLLRAARVRRGFTTSDMGLAGPATRIYINERLTKSNRLLFHRAREVCRSKHWKYVWTRRGRIYLRKEDGRQAVPVRSDHDLKGVFK